MKYSQKEKSSWLAEAELFAHLSIITDGLGYCEISHNIFRIYTMSKHVCHLFFDSDATILSVTFLYFECQQPLFFLNASIFGYATSKSSTYYLTGLIFFEH